MLCIKGGERPWRAAGIGAIDMAVIGPDDTIPKQMETFWPSVINKNNLQRLTCMLATEQQYDLPTILLSGFIADGEVVPAQLFHSPEDASRPSIDTLTGSVEEADERLVLHCAWKVSRGCKRLLVISNDTDAIVWLLRSWPSDGWCVACGSTPLKIFPENVRKNK